MCAVRLLKIGRVVWSLGLAASGLCVEGVLFEAMRSYL